LGVADIIVCGHSHCGAMKGLVDENAVKDMPAVAAWLKHAEATRRILREKYSDRSNAALLTTAIEENVLVQLENLRTHPAVAAAIALGKLKLHAWVFKIETGEVFAYDPKCSEFLPVAEMHSVQVPPLEKLSASHSI
jgi:carbonic anhydrase